ncbi:LLM class F420-dependent oxidoreductase [Leekyejoonella antrihumi]|uniref:LLM class F420-dependent oxidoreductase n=1 Tax=Leekyejoonella antrihumi TaxID=1660198 RepID=A0A563E9J6_9MICO|nr:LLM class F420-dependent oxidoreductase [Leekyejoonella antrihumi]TWP38999.1 LLM class F420-dependent oxidoreductase [Leekyejoonella antrihumi]
MDLRIFTEPQQGATYDELLRVAQATQAAGFDGFFRSDHYLKMGDVSGLPGPTDAWVTLAGLARETAHLRLGTLVTSATFRNPGPLAISVAQVDQMSGGRIELGYGAGWYEQEHTAYGLDFPSVKERFDRFEEHLAVITGLWSTPVGATFSYAGAHVRVQDSPALPKPLQPEGIPLIIGGHGKRRTPALAARYASEFNAGFTSVGDSEAAFERTRAAMRVLGRAADSMTFSTAQVLCVGSTEADLRRRADAIGRDVDDLRSGGFAGSPAEVVEQLGRFADIGASRAYLQLLDLSDLDHLELVASEVLPQLG